MRLENEVLRMKNTQLLRIALSLILFTLIGFANAQNGTLRGFVYEEKTGEPVIFTNVVLENTSIGASTDVNGYYIITGIPVGTYTIRVTNLGYDTIRESVSIKSGQVVDKNLFLGKASYTLETINVTASQQEMRTETRTSVIKLTPKEISKIPSIGGQADIAQYLQVLPGVVFTGDQGGQIYIRGGSPIQNKVLMDGMVIYNPFHSIGLFSVFDTDILRNVEVFTGGFGAEYGGRISSIMDLRTRDGNKKSLSGKVSASTFGANVLLEGPIARQKEGDLSATSFIVSFKNSYLEESSKLFYDYVDSTGLPFNYTDLYGKVSIVSDNGSKINLFGFNYDDEVNNYRSLSDFNWQSSGVGANFVIIPGKSPVLLEATIAYSDYKISLEEAAAPPRTSSINGFNLGVSFTYFSGRNELKYGIEMLGFKTDYFFVNAASRNIQQTENTTELGAYGKYKLNTGKFIIEPSMRLQWYASLGNLSPEPRLSMKYNATDHFRIKMATGLYSQNLISARSDRDVVNLFYGFLSGPDNLPKTFDGDPVNHKLQKSEHIILGFEYDVFKNASINIEGYFKNFSQLTNLNRNKIFEESEARDQPDLLKKDFIIETGDANGVDFTFNYDLPRFSLWAVYSLGVVNRYYENIEGELEHYHPHFDRRHNVNFVASTILGAKYDWEINFRWNFGSGFPFTETGGFYELISFDGGINSEYITENGELGILYDDLNAGRLPTYHRLDFSVKKTFYLSEDTRLEANLSVTNIYNRENIFFVDRITNEEVYQLPVMPSFGLSLNF